MNLDHLITVSILIKDGDYFFIHNKTISSLLRAGGAVDVYVLEGP